MNAMSAMSAMRGPGDGLPPLREVIADLQLSARKALGQNFILDFNLLRRIALAGGPVAGVHVLEIGPGPGGLTRALLMEGAAKVTVIERDQRFRPVLEAIAAKNPGRLEIIFADALTVDYTAAPFRGVRIVSNLPYNIATPLLLTWLSGDRWPPFFVQADLMFQKEVVDRIVARPKSKAFGRLSVLAQWRTEARLTKTLPPRAFTPPPKVTSALVTLKPRTAPASGFALKDLEQVTAAAFGQRRKMLRSALKPLQVSPERLLSAAGIAPTRRGEELDVADFCALAAAYARLRPPAARLEGQPQSRPMGTNKRN